MKAAKLTEHPSFRLMRQTDVQNVWHMQMPRWLFSDPRYADMSLDAKVTYTFLLNRFQLSRRNGWVNDDGEVFVIFPRKALAKELRICEQRVTAAFRKLAELQLIWEKRCGRGDANQIYCAVIVPFRARILIPETEMWAESDERPAFVLRNMPGAQIDFVITHVDREAGFAIGSRHRLPPSGADVPALFLLHAAAPPAGQPRSVSCAGRWAAPVSGRVLWLRCESFAARYELRRHPRPAGAVPSGR